MSRESLKAIDEELDRLLEQVDSLEEQIASFDGDNKALYENIQGYINRLKELHSAAQIAGKDNSPVEVPVELLKYVDEGGNPDVFLIESIKSAVMSNQNARGKSIAFREFREKLLAELESNGFEKFVAQYKEAVGEKDMKS